MQYRSIIAIDPGKRTGWAIFQDAALVDAGTFNEIRMLTEDAPMVGIMPAIAVIELPVIYPLGKGKGDPNDLIALAVLVGDLRGFYRLAGFAIELVKPRTWKGTVPKHIHHSRVLAALMGRERALLPKRPNAKDFDHNMLDAVGLGLWFLSKEGIRL
jgi:hypothetical protein